MSTAEEGRTVAKDRLGNLQRRLASLTDTHPSEPNEEHTGKVADLNQQIAEVEQEIECQQTGVDRRAAGGPAQPAGPLRSQSEEEHGCPLWNTENKAARLDEKMARQDALCGAPLAEHEDGTGKHYVVFQNGINGDRGDWLRFLPAEVLADPEVTVVVSQVNEKWRTHDGVAKAGHRLAQLLKSRVPRNALLTVVGHSLGGLMVRAALLDLERSGVRVDERWRPHVFCTFSTPHLGTFQRLGFVSSPMASVGLVSVSDVLDIGSRAAGDGAASSGGLFSATERKILSKFQRRILFGATPWADDRTVPCFSSLLLSRNCVKKSRKRPSTAAADGDPMPVDDRRMMPHSGKGDVLAFTTSLKWEKFMISIPVGGYLDVGGTERHTGIISHGSFRAPGARDFFWRSIVGCLTLNNLEPAAVPAGADSADGR